ncbi:hypothetical protein KIM372_13070 [Bombiscardovia nodaiensis]|uniref:Glycosyl transferase family 28 C-terminal domain-containing protein n=1 Tax=Bombiscardovia nodaiensis TaxID=2932181 RepID=A0ABM8B926_9BIFI|nr:hypothetical protein KIM372_13070 [Bombiscardovia nodaiensis]
MILVTVGTHEQPFNRLLEAVDSIAASQTSHERWIVQYGFSSYQLQSCQGYRFVPADQMETYLKEARIVITHGGPASFMELVSMGKTPIVVPRQACFDEHVNDHQVDFTRQVAERIGGIIPIYNIDDLPAAVEDFDLRSAQVSSGFVSHHAAFVASFTALADQLVGSK